MGEKVSKQGAREAVAQKVLVGSGLFGAVVGAGGAALVEMDVSVPRPVLALATLVVIAVMAWATVIYWRNVDEAAREAHKFAWFWGGSAGLIATLPLAIISDTAKLEALFGVRDASGWVVLGLVAVAALQIAGYGLAWAGWWLVRRR
jgi:hypothetical protein